MLPSAHGKWANDVLGGPIANNGSPFSPMQPPPGQYRSNPILPSRQRMSSGGAPPEMTPAPQSPVQPTPPVNSPQLVQTRPFMARMV